MSQTAQDMSLPQNIGGLFFLCDSGTSEIYTDEPSSLLMDASTRGASQAPQEVLTDIPHFAHV
jgi:hypothetical protein